MGQKAQAILWAFLVVLVSYVGYRQWNTWEIKPRHDSTTDEPVRKFTAGVLLVGYGDEAFPGRDKSGSYLHLACGEALVPTDIPVSSNRLGSVLLALSQFEPGELLHNPLRDKGVKIDGVTEEEGVTVVRLSGDPGFGGLCDLPRFRKQLEGTIALFTKRKYRIELNGTERAYRCLGDTTTAECVVQ